MRTVAILLALTLGTGRRGETTYYFGADEAKTTITFDAKTDVATISGTTHKVSGKLTLDLEAGTGSCQLSVPVESMTTGIDGADRSMRGPAYLDAAKFPKIEFKADKGALTAKPSTWTAEGKFTLHGVTQDLTIAADVKAIPAAVAEKAKLGAGNWVRVKTEFKVKLSDYGIKVPDRAVATVDDTWNIAVSLFGTTEKPPGEKSEPKSKTDGEEAAPNTVKARPVTLEGAEGTRYKFGGRPVFTNIKAVSETEAETLTVRTNVLAGLAAVDSNKGTGKIKLSIPVASLKTGSEKRDAELQGAAGFDAEKYPNILFETTKFTRKEDKNWAMEGTLSLHGKNVAVSADVALAEVPQEMVKAAAWGNKPGLKVVTSFSIKLSDFGITIPDSLAGRIRDEFKLSVDLVALKE